MWSSRNLNLQFGSMFHVVLPPTDKHRTRATIGLMAASSVPPSKGELPQISESELDTLLRAHHQNTLQGCVVEDDVQALVASAFTYLAQEAQVLCESPLTKHMAQTYVLRHRQLPEALGHALVGKLICESGVFSGSTEDAQTSLREAYTATFVAQLCEPSIMSSVLADLAKAWIADPATQGLFQPMFFFKGFQALTTYRVAHRLWTQGDACSRSAALLLQSRMAELYAHAETAAFCIRAFHPDVTIYPDHLPVVYASVALLSTSILLRESATVSCLTMRLA